MGEGAADALLAIQKQGNKTATQAQTFDSTVDSGAAEVVAPPTFMPGFRARPSVGSKAGAKYRTDSGNLVPNHGENKMSVKREEGEARAMTFQIADVTKPLAHRARDTG